MPIGRLGDYLCRGFGEGWLGTCDKDGSLWSRQAVLGLIYDSLTQLTTFAGYRTR